MIKRFLKFYFDFKVTKKRIVWWIVLASFTYLFFTFIIIPIKIKGISMEPTYKTGQLRFVNRLSYVFEKPKRGDIVTVKFAGNKVMLLKRVVALEGDSVEFKNGKLLINNIKVKEPYLKNSCNWNLPAKKVKKGNVYVVGDNRKMPIKNHMFGQTNKNRIVGKVICQKEY